MADFDNDGNLDAVISSVGRPAVLLRNRGIRKGNWIQIRAQGTRSNTFGLGATVVAQTAGQPQVREINNAASYLSSSDTRLHIGLGEATLIPQLEISWPGGRRQVLQDVAANQVLVVREPEGK